MKTIRDLKAIMNESSERKEFISGLACCVGMMALAYVVIVLFG